MSFKTDMIQLLNQSARLCKTCSTEGITVLENAIMQMQKRLNEPLRVAVVGIMKAGKSTFLNSLIGADILYTGELETTYTVCWFRYGVKPGIVVHLKNSSQTIQAPMEDLEKWSVRASESSNPLLNQVEYIEIMYPSDVLKTIEFIDTPGLNSPHKADSQNSIDFLSLYSADYASDVTIREAGKADAIIYAFSRAISAEDKDALNAFYGGEGASASPINSIGILTKVDGTGIWSLRDIETPVEKGSIITNAMMGKDEILKRVLYTVLPVCAKPCAGIMGLGFDDWETLRRCAELDDRTLQRVLYFAERFASNEDEISNRIGTCEQRKRIMTALGQYGIFEAVRLLKTGMSADKIQEKMQDICGLDKIRKLTEAHFGNRSFLIKSQYVLNYLRSVILQLRSVDDQDRQLLSVCSQISTNIDSLSTSAQVMRELEALKMYYTDMLKFESEEEKEDFLRIMGEKGRSVEDRLGVFEPKTVAELAEISLRKSKEWTTKANGFLLSRNYKDAAMIATRACEELYFHLSAVCE